jgi:hypothetical protein
LDFVNIGSGRVKGGAAAGRHEVDISASHSNENQNKDSTPPDGLA